MIAVVAGSTGLVGHELVSQLLSDDFFTEIIVISRKTFDISHQKIKNILISDLSELLKKKDQLKGDIFFCCLGTTIKAAGSQDQFYKVDHDGILSFAQVAEYHQAQKFLLVSAQGAHPGSRIFYSRVKGKTESDIQKLKLQKVVVFRPSLLIGMRKEHRSAEKILSTLGQILSPLLPEVIRKKVMTPAKDLAHVMIGEAKKSMPETFRILEAAQL